MRPFFQKIKRSLKVFVSVYLLLSFISVTSAHFIKEAGLIKSVAVLENYLGDIDGSCDEKDGEETKELGDYLMDSFFGFSHNRLSIVKANRLGNATDYSNSYIDIQSPPPKI